MSTSHTLFAVDGPIAALPFNRPEARNAMTWTMYDALAAACETVDADPAIRVFVLRGVDDGAFVAAPPPELFHAHDFHLLPPRG